MDEIPKSRARLPSASDGEDNKVSTGTSGSTLSSSNAKNGLFEDDNDDKTSTRARRGRSFIIRGIDFSNKISATDSDAKSLSPSGPTAYLNSVRSNLTFDTVSSPMHDKAAAGASSHSSSGNSSGYKLSQKRRTRLQESGNHHKPAEVFRKDLISAMKIPDTSQLLAEEYWVMRDPWRMEWEKGVQVPVNPTCLPATKVEVVPKDTKGDFRMPRKMIKTMPDVGDRDAVNLNVLADSTCRYDLDEVDVAWLKVINDERTWMGYQFLDEFTMEIIMEELETQCHENMQLAIKTKVGLGIEYDENIVCDVCKSPDCEEGNEMVFCDGCNLCVHQACYGILKVPDGSWLCKPCAVGIRGSAVCILCGKKGGAMKSTKSGRKWAHMSCALWIPEINIADPERMEPITKISHIPSSRWSLLCTVCKERSVGACIQCSVKHCVTPYHVTCAMESGFDMITDCCSPNSAPNAGESAIIFRSYCQKHSKNYKKKLEGSPGKKTEEEKRSDRQKRIAELEEEFYTLIKCEGVANALNIPVETVTQVTEYWKLKRKANFNRFLVTPKQEEGKALAEAAETGLQRRLRMFTHLRQDLERVRNLCYMIGKREKMKRSSVKTMTNIFLAQCHYLEYRMSHSANFDPKLLLSSLPRFGLPVLLERAKRESQELAKTKEWSQGNSPDASISEPGKADQEKIRSPQPRIDADIIAKGHETQHVSDERLQKGPGPKNGLIANVPMVAQHRRLLKLSKSEKKAEIVSQSKKTYSDESTKSNNDLEQQTLKKSSNLKKLQTSRAQTDLDDSVTETTSEFKNLKRKRSFVSAKTEKLSSEVREGTVSSSSEGVHDTVKRKLKGRLKRQPPDSSDASSTRRDSVEAHCKSDTNTALAESRNKSDRSEASSPIKKLKKPYREERVARKQRQPSVSDMDKKEKARTPPARLGYINYEDSDANTRPSQQRHKPKMTISTETISEMRRLSARTNDEEGRKRSHSKNAQSTTEKAKKPRLDHSTDESRPLGKPPRSMQDPSSADDDTSSTKSAVVSSTKNEGKDRKKTSSSQESALSESAKNGDSKQRQAAKNGQRALAPSGGRRGSVAHDRTGDVEAGGRRRPSGQELEDQKRSETPPGLGQNSSPSLVRRSPRHRPESPLMTHKLPRIEMDESNMAFFAAGLGIGYGSLAPAPQRQISRKKSPAKSESSGLKWVPLVDGDEDNSTVERELSYPPCAATPKDQEGYRGDMDESDSDFQGTSHSKHHQRKLSSRKRSSFNPGKHRTGIGVLGSKISDSSDDDFDISFTKQTGSAEKAQRQKLRPITSNVTGPDLLNFQVPFTNDIPESSKGKLLSTVDKYSKNVTEPKNVKAVGGTPGGLKSERDAEASHFFSRTTDGNNNLQKNFFDHAEQMTPFINNPLQDKPPRFVQDPFVNPQTLDFHHGNTAFHGVNLFPYGAYNPWQMPHNSSLPSIVPHLPVFYQYPPLPTAGVFERDIRSSPPPMPDSTLSPESVIPTSASVAVQASSELSAPILDRKQKTVQDMPPRQKYSSLPQLSNPPEGDAGNEWEIVRDGDEYKHGDGSSERRHRHKNKKKKKKKKRRRRMLFPDGYESDKRDISSPSLFSGPTYGAIVSRGQSTQYDVPGSSSHTSVSECTSASMRIESDTDRKSTDSSRKIVLKINKKDLVEEMPTKELEVQKVATGGTFSLDPPQEMQVPGLKLTFKRSGTGHLVQKYNQRKKLQHSRHRFSLYTVSSSSARPGPGTFPVKKERTISRPGMLKRLGLDLKNLPDTETSEEGIGTRALRERKPVAKPKTEQTNGGRKNMQKLMRNQPRTVSSSSSLTLPSPLHRNLELKVGTNALPDSGNPAVKRGRGRPRKIRPGEGPETTANPRPRNSDLGEQSKPGEQKNLAGSTGLSTQTSKNSTVRPVQSLPRTASTGSAPTLPFQPGSAGSLRHRGSGSVAIRSFSTDSDQNPFHGCSPRDHQPARHWKKRKVHEHETQVSEHPNNVIQAPALEPSVISPQPTPRYSDNQFTNSKAKKSPKARNEDHSGIQKARSVHRAVSPTPSREKDVSAAIPSSNCTTYLQSEKGPSEFDRKEKRQGLKLNIGPRCLSKSRLSPSLTEEKIARITTPTKPSPALVADSRGTSVSSLPSPSKPQRPRDISSPGDAPSKPHSTDFSLGFALQTGPLNDFKIPKKVSHATSVDAKLPTDT